jgi:hypothetical protein
MSILRPPCPGRDGVSVTVRASQISPQVRALPLFFLEARRDCELHVGWLAVVSFHVYLCFSTVVSSTTRSTISPAMSSAALRSSCFFWATSTRAACQADQ